MLNSAIRWSGLSLALGGLLLGVMFIALNLNLTPPHRTSFVNACLLIAALLILFSLPGMFARQAEEAGWLGLLGHVALGLGLLYIVISTGAPLFNLSRPGGESWTAFVLGIFALIGMALTAVVTLRAGVYPRWTGVVMLVGAVGFLFSFFIAENLPPLAGKVGAALFSAPIPLAFIGIGLSLWSGRRALAR